MSVGDAANLAQIISVVPIFLTALTLIVRHQCHERRCFRPAFHAHPHTGHPLCKPHYRRQTQDLGA